MLTIEDYKAMEDMDPVLQAFLVLVKPGHVGSEVARDLSRRCVGEREDGAACQRRVAASGLCWQHRFPPAKTSPGEPGGVPRADEQRCASDATPSPGEPALPPAKGADDE